MEGAIATAPFSALVVQKSPSRCSTSSRRGDRFIPSSPGGVASLELLHYKLVTQRGEGERRHEETGKATTVTCTTSSTTPTTPEFVLRPSNSAYQRALSDAVFGGRLSSRLLDFRSSPSRASSSPIQPSALRILSCVPPSTLPLSPATPPPPRSPSWAGAALHPSLALDIPCFQDDYYSSKLDWGESNLIAVSLAGEAWLWDVHSGSAHCLSSIRPTTASSLCTPPRGPPPSPRSSDCVAQSANISALRFAPGGTTLLVARRQGTVQLWDVAEGRVVRTLDVGRGVFRFACASWNPSFPGLLSLGSHNWDILNVDLRSCSSVAWSYRGHTQEVTGLCWSPDGKKLASGGNDNAVHVWDMNRQDAPLHRWKEHKAGVRALAWHPASPHTFASGGGSADGCIKVWDVNIGSCLQSTDTSAQVCSLVWNGNTREILSSHGAPLKMAVWSYPSMARVGCFGAPHHKGRVLDMAMSPDRTQLASASGEDEKLLLWGTPFGARRPRQRIQEESHSPLVESRHVIIR